MLTSERAGGKDKVTVEASGGRPYQARLPGSQSGSKSALSLEALKLVTLEKAGPDRAEERDLDEAGLHRQTHTPYERMSQQRSL